MRARLTICFIRVIVQAVAQIGCEICFYDHLQGLHAPYFTGANKILISLLICFRVHSLIGRNF